MPRFPEWLVGKIADAGFGCDEAEGFDCAKDSPVEPESALTKRVPNDSQLTPNEFPPPCRPRTGGSMVQRESLGYVSNSRSVSLLSNSSGYFRSIPCLC